MITKDYLNSKFSNGFNNIFNITGVPVTIKIPKLTSNNYNLFPTTALISSINSLESNNSFDLSTCVCKLKIDKLEVINGCPTENLKSRNSIIIYNNIEYEIFKEEKDSFGVLIILYIKRRD